MNIYVNFITCNYSMLPIIWKRKDKRRNFSNNRHIYNTCNNGGTGSSMWAHLKKGGITMNVSRESKKTEAIKRMKALGLFTPCIKHFDKYDEVQLSEMTGGLYEFSREAELTAKVKEFEAEYNALVYHVIHTFTQFGELYNFLYVSDHEEEWEMDNDDIKDNYVMCYVWNKDDDWCSEFGTIAVRQKFGGLVRIS